MILLEISDPRFVVEQSAKKPNKKLTLKWGLAIIWHWFLLIEILYLKKASRHVITTLSCQRQELKRAQSIRFYIELFYNEISHI